MYGQVYESKNHTIVLVTRCGKGFEISTNDIPTFNALWLYGARWFSESAEAQKWLDENAEKVGLSKWSRADYALQWGEREAAEFCKKHGLDENGVWIC